MMCKYTCLVLTLFGGLLHNGLHTRLQTNIFTQVEVLDLFLEVDLNQSSINSDLVQYPELVVFTITCGQLFVNSQALIVIIEEQIRSD